MVEGPNTCHLAQLATIFFKCQLLFNFIAFKTVRHNMLKISECKFNSLSLSSPGLSYEPFIFQLCLTVKHYLPSIACYSMFSE